jgi:hypothetical protein
LYSGLLSARIGDDDYPDFMSMADIPKLLKSRLGAAAKRVPTRELPNWLVRIAALRDPAIRLILPELGKYKNAMRLERCRAHMLV